MVVRSRFTLYLLFITAYERGPVFQQKRRSRTEIHGNCIVIRYNYNRNEAFCQVIQKVFVDDSLLHTFIQVSDGILFTAGLRSILDWLAMAFSYVPPRSHPPLCALYASDPPPHLIPSLFTEATEDTEEKTVFFSMLRCDRMKNERG